MKEQNHTLIDLFSGKVDKSNYPRTFWLNRLVNERNQTVNVARRLQEIADTETTTAALVLFSPDVIATAEQVIAYNELDEFAKDPLEVVVRPKKQPGEPHGFVDPNHIVGIIPLGEAARQQARQLKLTP
jgi:hypothetical protein